ncbi:hypothetical protein GHT06_015802 [Daphnia sinensis]|uniref:Uncharacterized protein n=1 Tax=Daphnia sinensis TaxID=1820382 RepID=A0AAD5LB63_9CRUS|nr:hypothetical protein GHT06_015802 [Daphnia sinensis]
MPKRKCLSLAEQKTSAMKKKKQCVFPPKKAAIEKEAEADTQLNASRRETPGRAAKRKFSDTTVIVHREGATKKATIGTSATTQPETNVRSEKSPTRSSRIIIKDSKENKMTLVLNRIETNIVETLRLHGVTLPDHDLQSLHRLRKSNQSDDLSSTKTATSVVHEPKDLVLPVVSPTLEKVDVMQLTEPPTQAQEKSKNEANTLNSQMTIAASVPPAVTHVTLHTNTNEGKSNFLENLALTQIVPTRTNSNLSNTKRTIRIAPSKRDTILPKKAILPKIESPVILPSVSNEKIATTTAPISTTSTNALSDFSNNKSTSGNAQPVSKVKIISLPAEDLQNLRNNKSHIQYLAAKKDSCPQEISLLSKLLLNQKNILAKGKPVMPIPGQRVQGIPFSSGAYMYLVQSGTNQTVPDVRKTTKKNSVVGKLLELATSNRCDYILPDAEKTPCNRNSCILQIARLKSELNQKSIALDSCNTELANIRAELSKANEYISSLRAQLEENTHTLCSYLAATSHINYE